MSQTKANTHVIQATYALASHVAQISKASLHMMGLSPEQEEALNKLEDDFRSAQKEIMSTPMPSYRINLLAAQGA